MVDVKVEVSQIAENILNSKCNKEVMCLWNNAMAELTIKELVWVHKKVSRKLLQAL